MKKHYDIGVVGFWYGANYGSLLNGYATYRLLKNFGKEVLMIEKFGANPNTDLELLRGHNVDFIKKYYDAEDIGPSLPYSELYKFNDYCDSFCVGSDQVWNYPISFGENMYLPFANEDKKLFSFAASFGETNGNIPSHAMNSVKYLLSRYVAISVREKFGEELLKNTFGIESTTVFEPVFCLDREEYEKMAENSKFKETDPYILTYILDITPEKRQAIFEYSKKLGLKVINVLDGKTYTMNRNDNNREVLDFATTIDKANCEDFLYAIKNANFIITDSFHGTAFSIIFNKKFISIGNPKRGIKRFEDLLSRVGLMDKLVDQNNIPIDDRFLQEIDYTKVNRNIEKEVKYSIDWLKNVVNIKVTNQIKLESNKIIKVVDDKTCTGCGACANICPTKAITMKENLEGFLNPIVDFDKCINCGLCAKTCIVLNPKYKNSPNPDCKAIMANEEIRMKSSSGGMFTLLADYVLENDGYVCGAAFDKDFRVEHIIIDNKKDLDKLRGSKYIQSNTKDCYIQIKKLLEKGNLVLFTGTPCQVAGLYAYLKKDYDNLITADLLCHGITSYKVFEKYLQDVHENKKLSNVKFRPKDWGWTAKLKLDFVDGTKYIGEINNDAFYVAYLQSISRNSVFDKCQFNKRPRQGDFTIGDFWGISKYNKEFNDNKGTSVVLINNEKANMVLKTIESKTLLCENVPIKYAIAGNSIIDKPDRLNKNREIFFKYLDTINYRQLVDGCKTSKIYQIALSNILESIPVEEKKWFLFSQMVVKNAKGRKIVTWISSAEFEKVLKKYFNIEVAFRISIRQSVINGKSIRDFSEIIGNKANYYIASVNVDCTNEIVNKLINAGYKEFEDFAFMQHKPIILENFNLDAKTYFDDYGNTIEGHGIIKKLVIPGWNNHITLGKDIRGIENLSFSISSNVDISIGDNCIITKGLVFQALGNGKCKVSIGNNCRFQGGRFRMFGHNEISSICIGNYTTFEDNIELHANGGKKMIIGSHCMFSYDIELWAGDGHGIFDVETGKNINTDYNNLPQYKNMLIIGDHVWVGKSAFIMHGTEIREGSIVGAKAVVKGRFPNNCSIAGNPAKIIRKNICWTRDGDTTDIDKCKPWVNKTRDID